MSGWCIFSWKKLVCEGNSLDDNLYDILFEGNTSRNTDLKRYDKRSNGFSVIKHRPREYKMQMQAVNFNFRIILHPLPLLRFTSRRRRSCN